MRRAVVYDTRLLAARRTAEDLEAHGYQVERLEQLPTGEEEVFQGAVDLLVLQIDTSFSGGNGVIGSGLSYDDLAETVSSRIYEAVTVTEQCLPALERGAHSRILYLTERESSIRECREEADYARHMILAGLNMQAKMLFNRLRKQGFTMRCFALSGEASGSGISPGEYARMNFCYDEKEPYIHSEENRFVMRDEHFCEISW